MVFRFTAPVKKSLPLKSESSDWYDARKQGLKCYRESAASWTDPNYVSFLKSFLVELGHIFLIRIYVA